MATSKLVKPHTPHPTCPPDVGGVGGAHPATTEKLFAANPTYSGHFLKCVGQKLTRLGDQCFSSNH
ncbi:hypothetical protein [Microcystis aeruginosa]